jgi:hypothetical protein
MYINKKTAWKSIIAIAIAGYFGIVLSKFSIGFTTDAYRSTMTSV